jgi:hypothetical protein
MQRVNMNKRGSNCYLGSVYTACAGDMLQIQDVRSIVKKMNSYLRDANAKDRYGRPLQYRVSLKGRDPIEKVINKRTGKPNGYNWAGDIVGGMANAGRIDVYIHQR